MKIINTLAYHAWQKPRKDWVELWNLLPWSDFDRRAICVTTSTACHVCPPSSLRII
jgi:hypothetical protein